MYRFAMKKTRDMPRLYTMESMAPILTGKEPLPNPRPPRGNGIDLFGCLLGATVYALPTVSRMMDSDGRTFQARYFLQCNQGGGLTGEGWVLWSYFHQGTSMAAFCAFAVCVHERVPGLGGNPMRGWRPGRCGLCGLDMSVDSSD